MLMDGYEVAVGDRVFDLTNQWGTVEQLLVDNRFVVVFSEGTTYRRITYSTSGISSRFRARTLYWHDPILVAPAKPDTGWLKIQQVCRAVIDALRVS